MQASKHWLLRVLIRRASLLSFLEKQSTTTFCDSLHQLSYDTHIRPSRLASLPAHVLPSLMQTYLCRHLMYNLGHHDISDTRLLPEKDKTGTDN